MDLHRAALAVPDLPHCACAKYSAGTTKAGVCGSIVTALPH